MQTSVGGAGKCPDTSHAVRNTPLGLIVGISRNRSVESATNKEHQAPRIEFYRCGPTTRLNAIALHYRKRVALYTEDVDAVASQIRRDKASMSIKRDLLRLGRPLPLRMDTGTSLL